MQAYRRRARTPPIVSACLLLRDSNVCINVVFTVPVTTRRPLALVKLDDCTLIDGFLILDGEGINFVIANLFGWSLHGRKFLIANNTALFHFH